MHHMPLSWWYFILNCTQYHKISFSTILEITVMKWMWHSKSKTRNCGAEEATPFDQPDFLRDVKASCDAINKASIDCMHRDDLGQEYDESCETDDNLTPLICNRYPVYAPPFSSGWATVSGIEKCILGSFLSQIELYISEIWQGWGQSSATAAAISAQIWPMGKALTVRAPKRKIPIFCFLPWAGLQVYL